MLSLYLAATIVGQGSAIYPMLGDPPRTLLVLNLAREKRLDELCLAASLQGLWNADPRHGGTKVYIVRDQADADWLVWLIGQKYVSKGTELASIDDLVKRSGVKGAVLSSDIPSHTSDIATTVAGCEHLALAISRGTAFRHRLNVKIDLNHRWSSNVEGYNWLLKKYRGQISKHVTSMTVPYLTSTHTPWQLRDYQVGAKLFTYWVSGKEDGALPGANPTAERVFLENVLATEFPPNTPVLGYPWSGDENGIGEWGGVTMLSRAGKFLIPTDNFSNLSVWASFPPSKKKLKPSPPPPSPVVGARYATLVMSDGDNLCTWREFFPQFWKEATSIGAPVGWTMGPTLCQLAPPIYDWVVAHQPAGASIGSGVSGLGYIAMDEYAKSCAQPDRIRKEFVKRTDDLCKQTGEDWLWIMRYGGPGSEGAKLYNDLTPSIQAVMGGYGAATSDVSLSHEGKIFHMFLEGNTAPEVEKSLLTALANPKTPRCFGVFLMNWGYRPADVANLSQFGKAHGIIWVTPEQLQALSARM